MEKVCTLRTWNIVLNTGVDVGSSPTLLINLNFKELEIVLFIMYRKRNKCEEDIKINCCVNLDH